MSKEGLWVGGQRINHDGADFLNTLKFAVVPEARWGDPAFESDDLERVLVLADGKAVEIVQAMIGDYLAHEFVDTRELTENIELRKGVMSAMASICAGDVDADYTEATVGVPPTLGYLPNLEVLWTRGAGKGAGILTSQLPFEAPDSGWDHIPGGSPWAGNHFVQKPGVPLSEALNAIHPFRGECAGALQLSVLLGCLAALGPDKTDALGEAFGPAFVGLWRVSEENSGRKVLTLASRFLSQLHDVSANYRRGAALAVPGDYIYFSNKDDYPDLCDGGWRGENCVYMGQDAIGGPHYSGLGLGWKTEFALRMFLGNAYLHDCNESLLADLRNHRRPDSILAIVEDPQTQLRFTARAVMRCPVPGEGPAPQLRVPTEAPDPLPEHEIHDRLTGIGFYRDETGGFRASGLLLRTFMDTLRVRQSDMRQRTSAGLHSADIEVVVGGWRFAIRPTEFGVEHLDTSDRVDIRARPIS